MKTRYWHGVWRAVVLLVSVVGCNQSVEDIGPSYAELVVTYNAELEALDRLETKRENLVNEYAAASAANSSPDTLSQLEGLLRSANDLRNGAEVDTTSDPNALLDDLTSSNGEARKIAGQLLEGLLGGELDTTEPEPNAEAAVAIAEDRAAFEAKLANLDAEITKQKERVERARKARDAAEAKYPSSQ